jgi:hypothetical protein
MCKILVINFPKLKKFMKTAVVPDSVRQKNTVCALMPYLVWTSRLRGKESFFSKPGINSDGQKLLNQFLRNRLIW